MFVKITRRNRARGQRGQTMAEFAMVLPVFALLLFGVIQFGIAFNNYLALTDAVRAGARTAAVSRHAASPATVAEDRVRDAAANLDQDELEVSVNAAPRWEPGAEVTVTATYPYEISLLGMVVKSGDLTSSTVERVE
jgi:Flp pilus assembly protein TadG